jgi:seryl-tRNA synthetase
MFVLTAVRRLQSSLVFHLVRRIMVKERSVRKSWLGGNAFLLNSVSLLTCTQLFQFRDRKDVRYLLSPTHEEEITSLVSSTVKSYKELPIRLYQICQSYHHILSQSSHYR